MPPLIHPLIRPLDIDTQTKAGIEGTNSTNLLDAAAGLSGYSESGFDREGGKEGLYAYVKLAPSTHKTEPSLSREGQGGDETNTKTLASKTTYSQKA